MKPKVSVLFPTWKPLFNFYCGPGIVVGCGIHINQENHSTMFLKNTQKRKTVIWLRFSCSLIKIFLLHIKRGRIKEDHWLVKITWELSGGTKMKTLIALGMPNFKAHINSSPLMMFIFLVNPLIPLSSLFESLEFPADPFAWWLCLYYTPTSTWLDSFCR